tara:strand:- start:492 stop:740 length:249 start_codon:yes stop_codon:yes gene_type:complete
MKKSEHEKFAKRVLDILGIEKINNLHKHQEQSLDNQLHDLLESHDYVVETVTDAEIMGRYKLVTEYIYPSDFVEISDMINKK